MMKVKITDEKRFKA